MKRFLDITVLACGFPIVINPEAVQAADFSLIPSGQGGSPLMIVGLGLFLLIGACLITFGATRRSALTALDQLTDFLRGALRDESEPSVPSTKKSVSMATALRQAWDGATNLMSTLENLKLEKSQLQDQTENLQRELDLARTRIGRLESELQARESAVQVAMASETRLAAEMDRLSGLLAASEEALALAAEDRAESLGNAAEILGEVAGKIGQSGKAVGLEASQASDGVSVQKDRISEAATAMRQMNAAMREVSSNTSSVAAISERMREHARSGTEMVFESLEAIKAVTELSSGLRSRAEMLEKRAVDVTSVTKIISEIAGMTNLLALNASIQAAGAGEHGREFAVIASEVRSLSERTIKASRQVNEVVNASRREAAEIISRIEEAVLAVDKASRLSSQSGRALEGIFSLAENVAAEVFSVSSAMEEQSAVTEHISRAVSEIDEVASRTGEGMLRCQTAIGGMKEQVRSIVKLGYVFGLIAEGRMQAAVEDLARTDDLTSLERSRIELGLRKALIDNPGLELLYVTDINGVQIADNIASADFQAAYGTSGLGRNWSQRPWFVGAMRHKGTYVSKVYTSEASGGFCVTISTPIYAKDGEIASILGADVNFNNIALDMAGK